MSTKALTIVLTTFLPAIVSAQGMDYSAPWLSGMPSPQPVVHGEIRNINMDAGDLTVVVSGFSDGRPLGRVPVEGGGTFQLYNVPPGTYTIKVIRSSRDTLFEQVTQIGTGQPIVLQMPDRPAQAGAGTVSTDRLQHPLSSKGAKLLRKAQDFAAVGDHANAIAQLQRALLESSAVPYAHTLLGTEYLKTGQPGPAAAELEDAVQMLPHDPVVHSNLGYALLLCGENDRGEQEVRKALELDHNNGPAQKILNYILKARAGNVRGKQ